MKDKLFKLGGALGVGVEIDLNLNTFSQIHKQNDACRLILASQPPS